MAGTELPHLFAYVKCGRKAWHLGNLFDRWEAVDVQRGDYTEHRIFRILASTATADDRQLARDYATPFTHDAA